MNKQECETRLLQNSNDIQRLEEERVELQQELTKLTEKRFYIGEIFVTQGGTRYILCCDFEYDSNNACYVFLMDMTGTNVKHSKRRMELYKDKLRNYVTKLPTMYPGDFGDSFKNDGLIQTIS